MYFMLVYKGLDVFQNGFVWQNRLAPGRSREIEGDKLKLELQRAAPFLNAARNLNQLSRKFFSALRRSAFALIFSMAVSLLDKMCARVPG